jgi:hypothetical protein
MNDFSRQYIMAFMNTMFSTFIAGLKAQPDYNDATCYPVKIYYENATITMKVGEKPEESFDRKTETKNGNDYQKFIETMKELCRHADNSKWVAFEIKNETQFFSRFSCGYTYKNYK